MYIWGRNYAIEVPGLMYIDSCQIIYTHTLDLISSSPRYSKGPLIRVLHAPNYYIYIFCSLMMLLYCSKSMLWIDIRKVEVYVSIIL